MNDALLEGTLGVVFTDVEGSTKLLRALGDRFDVVLARHHELMRGHLDWRRGRSRHRG